MTSLIFATLLSVNTNAATASKTEDCAKFGNAALANADRLDRVKLGMIAINSAFDLGYDEQTVYQLVNRVYHKIMVDDMKLDSFERIAVFGCTYEVTTEDAKPFAAFFSQLLAEK